jgi:RNA polymerase sigma-70 factor (ECF subfamily)
MSEDLPFEELMGRLRAGDQDAAAQVFHRFARRLIALARSRLDKLVRPKVDPEDVVQSVFRSFFARHAEDPFDLNDWDSLWAVLTVVTVRKCGHRLDHLRAACRDVQREVPAAAGWEVLAREPTPSQAALLTETLEQLMRALDDRDRQILTLSLQGLPPAAISAQVGYTERTVQRVLQRVRKWLERRHAEAGGPLPDKGKA